MKDFKRRYNQIGMNMASFLIAFKPDSESPRGWPLEEFQRLIDHLRKYGEVEEKWRFYNHKKVAKGDRAFLLLQGKRGPAIIGYGRVNGEPEKIDRTWFVPIKFEKLVNPFDHPKKVLASKDYLLAIKGSKPYWRTQFSGRLLPENIAANLETHVVGKKQKPRTQEFDTNPDWTRDELIIALNVYLNHRSNTPGKNSKEIIDLSRTLNRLGEKLFPLEERSETFRNVNGVYMKLMNS